jgi:hypothetical protein
MAWIPVKGDRKVEWGGYCCRRSAAAGAGDERHGRPTTGRWQVHVHTTIDLELVGEDHRR